MKKVYISVDIEGMEATVSSLSILRTSPDFATARKRLARGVNAAARACFDSGYDEVVACDGHADMENLVIEDLDPRVQLISGSMRSSLQMQGIDEGFDAYVSFGHAGAGQNVDGVLNHCYNGGKIYNLRLNGQTMNTETVVNAATAGFYDVPLVAVIGDEAVCREVRAFVPNVEGIAVKRGYSRYSAISVHPQVAEQRIYDGVKAALARRDEIRPLKLDAPLSLEIDFKDTGMADTACLVPGVQRLSPRTVRFEGDPETVFKVQTLLIYRLVDRNS